jgi:hypothetical protein
MIGKIVVAAQSTYNSSSHAVKQWSTRFYSRVYTPKIL